MTAYLVNLATLFAIYGILAASLNLLIGYAGIFSVAHAVFFGIGAYAAAQCALLLTPDLIVALIVAGLLAGLLSVLLSLPALRVRGEYFVAVSLGVQMVAFTVFSEAKDLTGGLGGLVGIPVPTLFGFRVSAPLHFLVVSLVVLALVQGAIWALIRSSFGRSLMAFRDSERSAVSFGKNIVALKALVVMIGCCFAGMAGALFAFQLAFVNVESFGMDQSTLLLAMVIIGGTASLLGPLVGALLLLIMPAALSFIPYLDPGSLGTVQQLIYGAIMILAMIFYPGGLVGRRK